jgi:hypothetical protein
MKQLKILFMIVLLAACSNSVDSENAEMRDSDLQITFKNISNSNLAKVTVADKEIGVLMSQSSKTVGFDDFGFDTGMVDEDVSVISNGIEYNNHDRNFWCGTEKVRVDSGEYIIKIDIKESRLVLYCDDPPLVSFGD